MICSIYQPLQEFILSPRDAPVLMTIYTDGGSMNGLHLRTISHAFDDNQVLQDVSVFVAPGELVCLLGPSGCGKTTLLRVAAGLEPLQSGQVEIDETTVADGATGLSLPPEKRNVGLMFQDFALFPHLTVWQNIAFGIPKDQLTARRTWIDATLNSMGLSEHAHVYPHTLSGGQQQRVALLRALAPEPKVLLLDEPFSGLDVTRRAQIRSETLEVVKQTGVASLMVTHDPEEAMSVADRILVMNEGRVVQDGAPIDLYSRPADAFVTALFGPLNQVRTRVSNGTADTPFGPISVDTYSENTTVDVLIRPEAFELAQAQKNGTPTAQKLFSVIAARPLGRSSVILFELPDGQQMEARMDGMFLPEAGTHVAVTVNPQQTHVFPAATGLDAA